MMKIEGNSTICSKSVSIQHEALRVDIFFYSQAKAKVTIARRRYAILAKDKLNDDTTSSVLRRALVGLRGRKKEQSSDCASTRRGPSCSPAKAAWREAVELATSRTHRMDRNCPLAVYLLCGQHSPGIPVCTENMHPTQSCAVLQRATHTR